MRWRRASESIRRLGIGGVNLRIQASGESVKWRQAAAGGGGAGGGRK